MDCYNYVPHFHPERLKQHLPKNKLIFVAGNGDISFALPSWIDKIFDVIRSNKDKTFLIQTKDPECMMHYNTECTIPDNVLIGTTIETNRDTSKISKAPSTETRIHYLNLIRSRKFITHEPILNFDLKPMVTWDKKIKPEIVWIGYANHTNGLNLDEPELSKTKKLIKELENFTDVRLKTIRDKLIID